MFIWLTILSLLTPIPATAADVPNIVFILSESLDGRLLRPGSPAKIPHIRRLMEKGVTFDTTYANNPVCAPSRSSLWSGRAPHRIPHMHNGYVVNGAWNNYEGLSAEYTSRMDQLLASEGGYKTDLSGKQDWTVGGHTESCMLASLTFNVAWPYNITANGGWNQEAGEIGMCDTDGIILPGGEKGPTGSAYISDWGFVQKTVDFIKAQNKTSNPQPWFSYTGTNILHPPYITNEFWYNVASDTEDVPSWPPLESMHPCDFQASMKRGCTPGSQNSKAYADFYSVERRRKVRRIYLAALEEFDDMVGTIVRTVEQSPHANNTVILLAADHGDMQLEHQLFYKMVAYDASARVPLVVSGSLVRQPGTTIHQPTQLLDIFPTVLALGGVTVPSYADGYNLAPFLWRGYSQDRSRPPFVVFQNHDEDISMSWFAISDGTMKLVQYGTGKEVLPQLFNLTADPGEMNNLQAVAPDVVASMDVLLRTQVDYPSVALDVAAYQKQQFLWWTVNGTHDWETEIHSLAVRWSPSWAYSPNQSLEAVKAWMANKTTYIQACDAKLSRV